MLGTDYEIVTATGNGVTTDFSANWNPLDEENVVVKLINVSTGVSITQTLGTHYTIEEVGTNFANGFVVAFITAPTSSYYVQISLESLPYYQSIDFRTSRGFQGEIIENALDKLTLLTQDINEKLSRTPRVYPSATFTPVPTGIYMPEPSENKLLGWDAGGNLANFTASDVPLDTINITAFAYTLLDDVNADTALSTLGVTSFAKTVLDDTTEAAARTTLNATRPTFLAYHNAAQSNVTGDGTVYTVLFNTEVTDKGGNFASNTFTAPVTGSYMLAVSVEFTGHTSSNTTGRLYLVTSNRTYTLVFDPRANLNGAGSGCVEMCVPAADMDAGDTAIVQIALYDTTAAVDLNSGINTRFSGVQV